ncbi:MAG: hypothetical protein J6M62_01025 [Selenomonadaceae bacterium]|nr:hypothetical protein [Selenomonadaceae bacterium]MBP3722116.1 hypothetical protein [Selenomonadaceae bacterium]
MMKQEWFWLKKAEDASGIPGTKDFTATRYPYLMDKTSFDKLEDDVIFYTSHGEPVYDDFLFEPTFMFSERFESIFTHLEPSIRLKYVHFVDKEKQYNVPAPLYYTPYLSCKNAVHEESKIILGKAKELVLIKEQLEDSHIIHVHLPADDIWVFSLEGAECILRRAPMGIIFKKVRCL